MDEINWNKWRDKIPINYLIIRKNLNQFHDYFHISLVNWVFSMIFSIVIFPIKIRLIMIILSF